MCKDTSNHKSEDRKRKLKIIDCTSKKNNVISKSELKCNENILLIIPLEFNLPKNPCFKIHVKIMTKTYDNLCQSMHKNKTFK